MSSNACKRSAKSSLGVGDDRHEPLALRVPLGPLDLIGTEQCVVEPADERRHRVARVQALVGIGLPGKVGVGGDLPATQVDGLETSADHFHGLRTRHRSERSNERSRGELFPEAFRAAACDGVLDPDRTA